MEMDILLKLGIVNGFFCIEIVAWWFVPPLTAGFHQCGNPTKEKTFE